MYIPLFSSQCYLQSFVGVCMSVSGSPLSESAQSKLTKKKLVHSLFQAVSKLCTLADACMFFVTDVVCCHV